MRFTAFASAIQPDSLVVIGVLLRLVDFPYRKLMGHLREIKLQASKERRNSALPHIDETRTVAAFAGAGGSSRNVRHSITLGAGGSSSSSSAFASSSSKGATASSSSSSSSSASSSAISSASAAAANKYKGPAAPAPSLLEALEDPVMFQLLTNFCKAEHSQEGVLFWADAVKYCELFNSLSALGPVSCNVESASTSLLGGAGGGGNQVAAAQQQALRLELRQQAAHIIADYIKPSSSFDIAIEPK